METGDDEKTFVFTGKKLFMLAQDAVEHLQMEEYSLFIEISKNETNDETLIHLVSGKYI